MKLPKPILKLLRPIPERWSDINNIQNIKLISSMYIWIFLVPFAAKLLSQVNEFATVRIFEYQFVVPLSLPFSWKVFYFSAIFFALATLLHWLRGPRLIRDHPTYASFRNEGKADWQLRSYAQQIGIDYDDFVSDLKLNMEEFDSHIPTGDDYSKSLFWHLHSALDQKRSKGLKFTVFFYCLGFLLIGYVVLENLYWVVKFILT